MPGKGKNVVPGILCGGSRLEAVRVWKMQVLMSLFPHQVLKTNICFFLAYSCSELPLEALFLYICYRYSANFSKLFNTHFWPISHSHFGRIGSHALVQECMCSCYVFLKQRYVIQYIDVMKNVATDNKTSVFRFHKRVLNGPIIPFYRRLWGCGLNWNGSV